MMRMKTRRIALSAAVAAIYAVLSFFGSVFGLTYGPVQCRFAEALCVLPFLFPETAWGLFVGCVLTNLLSAYGPADVIFGSLATLLAGLMTARVKKWWLAPLPCVLTNGVIVGAVIAWMQVGATEAFWPAFAYNGLTVAAGEAAACYVFGAAVLRTAPRIKLLRELMPPERKERLK